MLDILQVFRESKRVTERSEQVSEQPQTTEADAAYIYAMPLLEIRMDQQFRSETYFHHKQNILLGKHVARVT